MPTLDEFVAATSVLITVVGGMRLFYGAWPWEASKTWYRTREAAHYLEALRGEKTCNTILRPVAETMETARPVALVQNVIDTNSDCFDRTQIYGYSPGEIILPSEEVAALLQKVKWHSLNSRKQPILRLQKRVND